MSNDKKVITVIRKDLSVERHAIGYAGSGCMEALQPFEAADAMVKAKAETTRTDGCEAPKSIQAEVKAKDTLYETN